MKIQKVVINILSPSPNYIITISQIIPVKNHIYPYLFLYFLCLPPNPYQSHLRYSGTSEEVSLIIILLPEQLLREKKLRPGPSSLCSMPQWSNTTAPNNLSVSSGYSPHGFLGYSPKNKCDRHYLPA